MKLDSIINIREKLEIYSPDITLGAGIVGMVTSAMMTCRSPKIYLTLYKTTGEERWLVKYLRLTKSNNWLRMHGYPMRRKH